MNIALTLLLAILIISLAIQAGLVWGFVRRLGDCQYSMLHDDQCKPAMIVLCLRGCDPFLRKCIVGIMHQDYPCYQVKFVVDHPTDPSLDVLRQVLDEHPSQAYQIEYLNEPCATCSLKCSSLIQAAATLPSDTHFLAQLDADTIPHRTWLRELATALAPDSIGAATGNRWYLPSQMSNGALVRRLWNAAAVVQMYWYKIAWGGTLAIKVSAIQAAGLVELWKLALCEDTMLKKQLSRAGLDIAFVPSLMMINREDCTLKLFLPWVTRQLLTARLYHSAWPAVVLHAFSAFGILVSGWAWGIALFFLGDWWAAAEVLVAMLVFQIAIVGLLPWLEQAVLKAIAARGEDMALCSNRTAWWRLFAIAIVTQWYYTWALVKCLFLKRIDWRGIHYEVNGPWHIKMLGYKPYLSSGESRESTERSL